MHLELLLPYQVFADVSGVLRVIVETAAGSMGLLPRRLDCVVALVPGILTYETAAQGMIYVAVDEGILVKHGSDVQVSVRQAIQGADLETLHDAVRREFLVLDAQRRDVRAASARIESGFMHRIAEFSHGR